MLFTSPEFILIYLPIVACVFFLLGRRSHLAAAAWLFFASMAFYAWWMPRYTVLLLGSICWNYFIGVRINAQASPPGKRRWLTLGITVDLLVLIYFKYANFLIDNLNALCGTHWSIGIVTLPIGISFFTFTQIAFLADAYQKGVSEPRPVHYGLFVSYFPHLVAGPVLHHAQMMPQFREAATYRFNTGNFSAGMVIFALGLIKKVILADGISPYADAVFNGAAHGLTPDMTEAWLGALAYTLQLYFDFSGYSDMAIGLSRMLNIRLPYNFDSPYKALNIVDFWRRWHMTLSAFLRDYLYIPLGGNRHGKARRHLNLFVTMVLGGLWHGASWNFVLWGALHGIYLMINHAWHAACKTLLPAGFAEGRCYRLLAWAITLAAVIAGWVFFRATTLGGALSILHAMTGATLTRDVAHPLLWNAGLHLDTGAWWCLASFLLTSLGPNSNKLGEWLIERCGRSVQLASFLFGASFVIIIMALIINATRDSVSAFIYFNF
ncbi:MAG: rane-bound O-acyltransferase family protein [Rhodocyclales bacterium]|nr:rane-bound O-acyltransferase family protein [Rhodocyclales bacterium]